MVTAMRVAGVHSTVVEFSAGDVSPAIALQTTNTVRRCGITIVTLDTTTMVMEVVGYSPDMVGADCSQVVAAAI